MIGWVNGLVPSCNQQISSSTSIHMTRKQWVDYQSLLLAGELLLTHCGPVMPWGLMCFYQHWSRYWLVAWRHQCSLVSLIWSLSIHLRTVPMEMFKLSITHWGRVTHICVSKLSILGSDNGLSPGRRQAIIWTNAEILLIGTLGTNLSEILSEIHAFSFKKMHLKMSSAK